MGNKELNNKILKNVRSKIVVSSLESEEKMKISRRNKIVSICAVLMIVVSGGLFTVNAATDGKIAEGIKEELKKVITINYDQSKYKVVTENQAEYIGGDEFVKYEMESLDGKEEVVTLINKSEFDRQNINAEINVNAVTTDDETSVDFDIVTSDR